MGSPELADMPSCSATGHLEMFRIFMCKHSEPFNLSEMNVAAVRREYGNVGVELGVRLPAVDRG